MYYLVWYYKVHRELRDFGERIPGPHPIDDVNPAMSLVAISLGGLILVPPFVSTYRSFKRIAAAQALAGVEERASAGIGLLLYLLAFFLLPFELVYAQRHLNTVWRQELATAERGFGGTGGAGPTTIEAQR